MNLNKEELTVGFIFGLLFFPLFGWWVFPIGIVTGYLWALSGMPNQDKFWRRWMVPTLPCFLWSLLDDFNSMAIVSYLLAVLVQHIGYGVPSVDPPDAGSSLGRFFWNRTRSSQFWTDVLTRGTIYSLLFISFLPMVIWRFP